jgi:lipoprotein-anchoring transpeptidase ErfK/SrfK
MRGERLRLWGLTTAIVVVLSTPLVLGASAAGAKPAALDGMELSPLRRVAPSRSVPSATQTFASRGTQVDHGNGGGSPRQQPTTLVHVRSGMTMRARPDSDARAIGTMPSTSKYYHVPLVTWIEEVSSNGRWGRVEVPYSWPRRDGWILIAGLPHGSTGVSVDIDLSQHRITVTRFGRRLLSAPAATGAPSSPTPPGSYFVTDRVPFSAGGSYGAFAFGISGIQPHLPPGWTGGNQLAIHGTNDPGSIGGSNSAGCVRVGAGTLQRLIPLLRLGTPIVIHP